MTDNGFKMYVGKFSSSKHLHSFIAEQIVDYINKCFLPKLKSNMKDLFTNRHSKFLVRYDEFPEIFDKLFDALKLIGVSFSKSKEVRIGSVQYNNDEYFEFIWSRVKKSSRDVSKMLMEVFSELFDFVDRVVELNSFLKSLDEFLCEFFDTLLELDNALFERDKEFLSYVESFKITEELKKRYFEDKLEK